MDKIFPYKNLRPVNPSLRVQHMKQGFHPNRGCQLFHCRLNPGHTIQSAEVYQNSAVQCYKVQHNTQWTNQIPAAWTQMPIPAGGSQSPQRTSTLRRHAQSAPNCGRGRYLEGWVGGGKGGFSSCAPGMCQGWPHEPTGFPLTLQWGGRIRPIMLVSPNPCDSGCDHLSQIHVSSHTAPKKKGE